MWQPTDGETIDQILELADLDGDEIIYDLGCGDARVLIEAAKKFGVKGVGLEIDPVRVIYSRLLARLNGVHDNVEVRRENMYEQPIDEPDVIFIFLSTEANKRLASKFEEELSPGTKVISYYHKMPGWDPVEVEYNKDNYELYLYLI